jgi:hypothetical protein
MLSQLPMSSQSIHMPDVKSGASGRYRLEVVEDPTIPELRREAGILAKVSPDYDGSVKGYHALSNEEKELHDFFLKILVKNKRSELDETHTQRSGTGEMREGHNLILDQGLNNIMTGYAWCNGFEVCAVGTGTTPTFTDSGAVTATAASTTVTSSGAFFTSGMTGMLLNFDSGEQRYITFVDTTHATLSSALTVSTPTLFTVWAVNQTGLDTEVKRTNTYLTGAGNCGFSVTSTSVALQRTYDFSVEIANLNYTELLWSNTMTPGANGFSRALIAGGTVTVLIGQALRVVYTLTITVSNATSTGSYTITGWPVAPSTVVTGSYSLGNPFGNAGNPAVGKIGVGGDSQVNAAAVYEVGGGNIPNVLLCTGTTLPAFGNDYSEGTNIAADSISVGSYSSGSFQRDFIAHFNTSNGNRTDFRGIEARGLSTAFIFIFDQNQTKDNLHSLNVNVTIKIGRVLSNP